MRQPSIADYICTLENPTGVFRTLGDIEAERDIYRDVAFRAGNSAAVFTYTDARDRRRMLKCYVRPNPRLREIYAYMEANRPALLPGLRLLRDELYVYSLSGTEGWTDVVEGEWIEGDSLDTVAAHASRGGDRKRLGELAAAFDDLCRELLAQEWAHGDLKPENIIVRPGGSMTLVDCDAVWIPAFTGQKAAELGTPGYRHPARDASLFDKRIDDYPMLLISASLHALALDPGLYGRYNTSDNLILSPTAVVAGNSPAHSEMLGLFARTGMARQYRMTEALALPLPDIPDYMWLFEQPRPVCGGHLDAAVACGRWGFTCATGDFVIMPLWDEAVEFRGDRAAVRLGGWWHVMDPDGRIVSAGLSYEDMRAARKVRNSAAV